MVLVTGYVQIYNNISNDIHTTQFMLRLTSNIQKRVGVTVIKRFIHYKSLGARFRSPSSSLSDAAINQDPHSIRPMCWWDVKLEYTHSKFWQHSYDTQNSDNIHATHKILTTSIQNTNKIWTMIRTILKQYPVLKVKYWLWAQRKQCSESKLLCRLHQEFWSKM